MDNILTQAQQILNRLATLPPMAEAAEASGDYRRYDEAKADLGEEALSLLPELVKFARLAARFAVLTSSAFDNWSREDLECVVIDILTDLRLYACRNGIDFERASEMALSHFEVESAEE